MLRWLSFLRRSLAFLVVLLVLAFVVGGIVTARILRDRQRPEERAAALVKAGKFEEAEDVYWKLAESGPVTLPVVVNLVDSIVPFGMVAAPGEENEPPIARAYHMVAAADAMTALFARQDTPSDVVLLGRYWWRAASHHVTESERREVTAVADADPPMPYANHLLAREAERRNRLDDAAVRYEKEGLAFAERAGDLDVALELWMKAEDWDKVAERLADPRYSGKVSARIRQEYAIHAHDWLGAVRWFIPAMYGGAEAGPLILAAISALAWFVFCATVGKVSERWRFRLPMYVGAFVLGVASVVPAIAIATIEEVSFKFVEKGPAVTDAIYFVLGVGLREELAKILLFLPLLPLLRKYGGPREVLACGALVGLGFAAEENILYFQHGDLSVALARFLTANFFHISTTAIVAAALYELTRAKGTEDGAGGLSRAFLTVIVLHGAYDFFLSNPEVASYSFVAMVVFVVLARQFLGLIRGLRGAEGRSSPLLRRFVISVTVIVGASFVYASTLVGPGAALKVMIGGLLGMAIVVIMFVQELSRL